MNIKEIKDSLQRNNFTGLRARLDTVIEFIDSQQAENETLKKENEELSNLCFEFGILKKASE